MVWQTPSSASCIVSRNYTPKIMPISLFCELKLINLPENMHVFWSSPSSIQKQQIGLNQNKPTCWVCVVFCNDMIQCVKYLNWTYRCLLFLPKYQLASLCGMGKVRATLVGRRLSAPRFPKKYHPDDSPIHGSKTLWLDSDTWCDETWWNVEISGVSKRGFWCQHPAFWMASSQAWS